MGLGRAYREPHVGCVCLVFVLNQNDSGTVVSLICFDSSLCKMFIPSLIPSFTLLFIIQCLPWLTTVLITRDISNKNNHQVIKLVYFAHTRAKWVEWVQWEAVGFKGGLKFVCDRIEQSYFTFSNTIWTLFKLTNKYIY